MNRMHLLDTAPIPGGGELRLFQCGDIYTIKIAGGGDLMNSQVRESEKALARLPCERIARRPSARVLVGGLGMGFTLAEALSVLPLDAEVVVAELVPAVVEWNRHVFGEKAGHPLRDPRTRVVVDDVAQVLKANVRGFDAILLDVDNGPEGMTMAANDKLYSKLGLLSAIEALKADGILAVWSAAPAPFFTRRLHQSGLHVEEHIVRARPNGRGERHMIWLASK